MIGRTVAVVVSCNGLPLLRSNLPSLQSQSLPFSRIIVVDNGSTDGSCSFIRQEHGIELIALPRNRGFAGGSNTGIRHALKDSSVKAIALLNNDVRLENTWHERAAEALSLKPTIGSCATCLLQEKDPARVDTAGICWTSPGLAENHLSGTPASAVDTRPEDVFGACAAAALYRRSFFETVGLFDESLFAYQEDVDLALRGQAAGWSCVLAPGARGVHQGFATNRSFPLGGTYADYYNARNRFHVLVKSLPKKQWRHHWRAILLMQGRLLLRSIPERRGGAVALGMLHAFLRLPRALRQRKSLPSNPPRSVETNIQGV